jgi:hypothetical protein
MNPDQTNGFWLVNSVRYGTPVIPLFVIRQSPISIPRSIVGESFTIVPLQLQPEWEIDVPKELILAVEEITATDACMN